MQELKDRNYLKLYNSIFRANFKENDLWWIKKVVNNPKELRESIKESKLKIDWQYISKYRKLSEEFMISLLPVHFRFALLVQPQVQ